MTHKVIKWKARKPAKEIVDFLSLKGYKEGRDYRIGVNPVGRGYINPLKNLTLLGPDADPFEFEECYLNLRSALLHIYPNKTNSNVHENADFEESSTPAAESAKIRYPDGHHIKTVASEYYIYLKEENESGN